jgi:hypothetical protein
MNNTGSRSPIEKKKWSINETGEHEALKEKKGLIAWWYKSTAQPDAPANATFAQREAVRKSHLLSTIVFWLLLIFILFIPACFVLPNHYVIFADLGMVIVCGIALLLNRAGKPEAAGLLLTVAFELALTMVIFTTQPLDEPSIQQYELYVFGELLCVSLLNPRSVFVMMFFNIAVITASLLWQPHTAMLAYDLKTQLIPMLVRPIGVQLLVAFVSYLWVKGTIKAIARADRAEKIAQLEHELAEQKQKLEEGIQQILQTHVAIANGNLDARAPFTQDNVLWQIARALNTLLVRLQRAFQAEKQLQRVVQAVNTTVSAIQQAEEMHQMPRISLTRTEIDPLIIALQGKTLAYTPPPLMQQSPPKAHNAMPFNGNSRENPPH